MNSKSYCTHSVVLLIFYKRFETTIRVLNAIKQAKPKVLFLSQDGPKNKEERRQILKIRKKLISMIDWDCELITNFYQKNLGFKKHVPEAIDLVFKKYDELIYLEDDTLPNTEFFRFLDSALTYYANDKRVMGVNGTNLGFYYKNDQSSHYLIHTPLVWGFGLYKRSWKLYDVNMSDWPQIRKKTSFVNNFSSHLSYFYNSIFFENCYNKKMKTWDFPLTYLAFKLNKYFVMPKYNYCVNLGFNDGTSPFIVTYNAKLNNHKTMLTQAKYDKDYETKYYNFLLRGGYLMITSN